MEVQDLLTDALPAEEDSLDPETASCLEQLSLDGIGEDEIKVGLEILATSSRSSETLRNCLAKSTILARLVQIISTESVKPSPQSLQPALRCIGNACFENEEAANKLATMGLEWVVGILQHGHDDSIGIAINVLNNICIQSTEAQKQACKLGLDDELLYLLIKPSVSETAVNVPLDLVLLIASHRKEANRHGVPAWENDGEDFTTGLLAWAIRSSTEPSIDDWACTIEIILTYVRDREAQAQIVESKVVDKVWDLLSRNEDLIAQSQQRRASSSGEEEEKIDPEEMRRLLKPESMSLTWILSDLAAHSSFVSVYGLDESWLQAVIIDTLLRAPSAVGGATAALNSDARPNAACQVLGNLLHALPPSAAVPLVQQKLLHQPLLAAMAGTDDADYLHSATGLLIKLARPSVEICKVIASDIHMLPALEKLNAHPMQQLKQDALALMRALGKNSPAVQERLKGVAKDVLVAAAAAQSREAANGGLPQAVTPGSITGLEG